MKIFAFILVLTFLSGCSVVMRANIKNSESSDIFVTREHSDNLAWHIQAGDQAEIFWNERCLNVIDNGVKMTFNPWPIPDNTVKSGVFESTINVLYKEQKMFFINLNGESIPLKKLTKCSNA